MKKKYLKITLAVAMVTILVGLAVYQLLNSPLGISFQKGFDEGYEAAINK